MRALCGEKSFFSPLFTANHTLFFDKTSTRVLNKRFYTTIYPMAKYPTLQYTEPNLFLLIFPSINRLHFSSRHYKHVFKRKIYCSAVLFHIKFHELLRHGHSPLGMSKCTVPKTSGQKPFRFFVLISLKKLFTLLSNFAKISVYFSEKEVIGTKCSSLSNNHFSRCVRKNI